MLAPPPSGREPREVRTQHRIRLDRVSCRQMHRARPHVRAPETRQPSRGERTVNSCSCRDAMLFRQLG